MLASFLPALDFSTLLQFVSTVLVLLSGAILLVKNAASRYFFVDANFEAGEGYEARHRIPIIGEDPVTGTDECVVCRSPGTKKCSRCKSVRYCSQACQSKHWEADHKLKCKEMKLSNKVEFLSSGNGSCRKKASGCSSISLVPARGLASKVLQQPKKILFPYDEFVKLFNWDKLGFPPCGLLNCGNSCFANVVLQCLACTQPLIAYLLERNHNRECIRKQNDWCFLCELQVHIERVSRSLLPFSPINILSRLPNIGGNLGYGRQEDAHEFMRFAIDTMQSVFLDEFGGEKALDPSTQETTLIHYIFGGHLQSQVICTKCNMISNRYENMMDLTVEIQGDAESLEECLDQFTAKEWLDGENMYKCDGCNDYVKAWKRLTVHQAPNILTIALKRFQSGRFGKLNKRVTFPENLDLTPYMSGTGDGTDLYTLYAVIVHLDMLNASYFGHYICYTKDFLGRWYKVDDCKVMRVEVEEVLAQGAYMLLYSRRHARREPFLNPLEATWKQSAEVDPESLSISKSMNPVTVLPCPSSDAGSQSNPLLHEKASNISLLRDTEHERKLLIQNDPSEEEPEDMDLDVAVEVNTEPQDLRDVDMDDSEPSSLGSRKLERGIPRHFSQVLEDVPSVKPMQSNFIPPVELSSVDTHVQEFQEPCYSSIANSGIEEDNNSLSMGEETFQVAGFTSDGSFSSKNIVPKMMKSSSSTSVTASSPVLEPLGEANLFPTHCSSGPKFKKALAVCGSSGSTNGVTRLDDVPLAAESKETRALASYRENSSSRGKSKPLFLPGFLDRPARKKSVGHEERIQVENCGADLVAPKVNGYSNGCSELKLAQYNVHEYEASLELPAGKGKESHPDSDTPFFSRGSLNKSYTKSLNKGMIASKELDGIGHPHNINCNGSAEGTPLGQSGRKDYRLETSCSNGKTLMSLSSEKPDNMPMQELKLEEEDELSGANTDSSGRESAYPSLSKENDSMLYRNNETLTVVSRNNGNGYSGYHSP